MIDFLSLLPPDRRLFLSRKIEAERREMARLYRSPDRWVGEFVLSLARSVRADVACFGRPNVGNGYENSFLWDVIPNLAKRVGCRLRPNESMNSQIVVLDGQDLRDFVANIFFNIDVRSLRGSEKMNHEKLLDPVELLSRDFVNGSPVVLLLDRIVPPSLSSNDRFAVGYRDLSSDRNSVVVSTWSPEFLEKLKKSDVFFDDDVVVPFGPKK